MDQFIYWGVFAAFALIVCLYVMWMIVADRFDAKERDLRSSFPPGSPPLHLHPESESHEDSGSRGGEGRTPQQAAPRTRPPGSRETGPDNGDPPDDPPGRTFWRGK